MRKYILPMIAVVFFFFALISVIRSQPVRKPALPPEPPPVSSYQETVAGVGLVEASTENIALGAPVSGLCTEVYVKVGDRVQSGQKLFSLDDRHLRAELTVRENALAIAAAQVQKLLRLPRSEEIPVAEAKVAEAAQALADARIQQQLIENVSDSRAISKEDLERRRIARKAAEARLNQAKAELDLLKAGAWKEDLQIARAQVALAEAEVQRIRTDIERMTITAPVDGVILQANIHPGEFAQAGPLAEPLIVFGNVDSLIVRTDVDEHHGWKVRPDASAYATIRGNTRIRVPLRFVRCEPYVVPKKSLTGDSTERVDTRTAGTFL
jgi:multidrug resistance efflux pump